MTSIGPIGAGTAAPATTEGDAAHARLRKATREVESYFVGFLLKQMHSSATKGGLFGQSSEAATYREMYDDAVAKAIGSRGAFGIADMLYAKLAPSLEAEAPAESSAEAGAKP